MSTSEPPPAGIEPSQLVGQLFADRFRVLRLVSDGANTAIYDAGDEQTGRTVTLKLIRPRLASSPSFRTRFDETMRSVAALSHPNIAAVFDWGIARVGDTSTAYVVIEQLTGGSLRDMFDRGRQLSPSQALAVGLDACRGLDYAHRRGFVHSELTPSKLVFGDDRRLRIIDFGLARLLGETVWEQTDAVPNHTAWYASPEQALSMPIDGKTDVYALCLSLHEAVTGTLPFKNDSTVATLSARVGKLMPVSADLGPLASVFERAGRPEHDERASAAEFGKGLVQAASKMSRPEPLPLLSTGLFETPAEQLRSPDDPTGGVTRPSGGSYVGGAPVIVVPVDEPDAGRSTPAGPRVEPEPANRTADPTLDDPTLHDPTPHDPTPHDPTLHDPTPHDPTPHDPTLHDPTLHDPTLHDPTLHDPTLHDPTLQHATPHDSLDESPDGGHGGPDGAPDGHRFVPSAPSQVVDAESGAAIPPAEPGDDLVILPLDSGIMAGQPHARPVAAGADTAAVAAPPPVAAATQVLPAHAPPAVAGPQRRRRRFPWKILLGLLVIAALAVLGVLATQLFETPVYRVPDLVEMPQAEARNLIAANGWDVTVESERSDVVPTVGQVVRTAPQSGVDLAEGEPFLIVVSAGPILRELPESTGLPLSEAQTRLNERGLEVSIVEQFDEVVVDGTVISWSVPGDPTLIAGAMVEPMTPVELVVSTGPAPRTVPSLVGRPADEVRAELEELVLVYVESGQEFSDEVAPGVVISQSLEAGTEVERGTEVTVVVSLGPDLVSFPDISAAANFDEAAEVLIAAGFEVELVFGDAQGEIQSYTIDGSPPLAGETFRRGTLVRFRAFDLE